MAPDLSLKPPSFSNHKVNVLPSSKRGFPKCKFLEGLQSINPYDNYLLSCHKEPKAEIIITALLCPFFHSKTGECRKT